VFAIMSGEKRPAPDAFGSSSQLVVKRQKSDANLNSSTVVLRPGQNGALVQAVGYTPPTILFAQLSPFSRNLRITYLHFADMLSFSLRCRLHAQAGWPLQSWNLPVSP
jgi:hypothetical protein